MKKVTSKDILFFFVEYIILFFIYNFRNIVNIKFSNVINLPSIIILISLIIIYLINANLKDKFKKMKWLLSISIFIYVILNTLIPSINILNYIFIFYFLLFISFITYKLFNYKFSISLGISTLILVLLLFILSLFNLLIYTKILIFLIIISGIVYLVLKYKNGKCRLLDDINLYIDETVIIFSILFIISILNGFERYVHYWDEYNMWALSAKKVILSNSIVNFSYPPIMALWSYFISLFDVFKEQNLYIGNSIYIYIFIMSLFSSIKDKKIYILLFLISISFCYLFSSMYSFNNLYADFPSAIVFGFGLIISYISVVKKKMPKIMILLPSIVITLMKPQGFLLATCLILITIILYSVYDIKWSLKSKVIKNNIIDIFKKFWFIILPLILYLFWTLISNKFLIQHIYITDAIAPDGLSTTFFSNPSIKTLIHFALNAFKYLDNTIFNSIIPLSLINYFILINTFIFICFYSSCKDIKKSILYTIPFIIAFICYFILTALSLLVAMPIEDALEFSSFSRYLDNFNVGIFMFVIWMIFQKFQIKKKYVLVLTTILIFISVPISKTFSFVTDIESRYENRNNYYSDVKKFNLVLNNTNKHSKIYIIDQEDKSGYLPMCKAQYYLYPRITNANGQINWKIQTKTDNSSWMLSAKTLEQTLIKNKFDYLFLYSTTNEFFDEISYMIKNKGNIENYKLFKINVINNSISLTPIV